MTCALSSLWRMGPEVPIPTTSLQEAMVKGKRPGGDELLKEGDQDGEKAGGVQREAHSWGRKTCCIGK